MPRKKQNKRKPYKPAGLAKPPVDPVVKEVAEVISNMTAKEISEGSWVSRSAVYNIFNGKTKKPQNLTVAGMLHAAGYGRKIVKLKKED